MFFDKALVIPRPMKNFFNRLLGRVDSSKEWWLEVKTEGPACTYYFGPFASAEEAAAAKSGYTEDLEKEGALGLKSQVLHCERPSQLTIYDESIDGRSPMSPAFSGQP